MTYQALARKWRPHRFDQIIGQPHIVRALSNALNSNKLHHAYLFTGTHGIGKTTIARIIAKSLNCESGITATPCDQCSNCVEINAGRFPDLYEIDAASRTKVEDTRDLLDNVPYAPSKGRFKVYLIDEVHMLSGHSFNALLKTLEEPPEHVKFLLATTDPQKLPATVLSRCLQFHLSKMIPEQIEQQLKFILASEKIAFDAGSLKLLSQASNGSMRDALSLLDQCIAYCNGKITEAETQTMLGLSNQAEVIDLLEAITKADAEKALSLTKDWGNKGANFTNILSELLSMLHQIAVLQSVPNHQHSSLSDYAKRISPEDVQLYYQIALMGQQEFSFAPSAQIGFEMTVIRMITFKPESSDIPARSPAKKTTQTTKATSDWETILNQLSLASPTLALAQQCSLESLTQDLMALTLKQKHAALLNDRHQKRIQDALTTHFNRPMKVTITIKETGSEAPAESAARQQEVKTRSAKKAISTDPAVQGIVQTFGATVIEDSIEPVST